MERTLYVTDLDGTLLNKNDRITPKSIAIINQLVEKGMLFTYATGEILSQEGFTKEETNEVQMFSMLDISARLSMHLSMEKKRYPGYRKWKMRENGII